jgi:N-acetyl sugar amidotransferase
MHREYKICTRCVMDTSDPDIVFDENGYCNHCTNSLKLLKNNYADKEKNKQNLQEIVHTVKNEGKNNKYDCIIGLSGGVDSSYLAYVLVKEYGLRPLAIHLDNGWNSVQAVANIHKLVTNLNLDLITHVIDWDEFKELQKSFLRASVVDLEMLSDHAIVIAINNLARKERIKYFFIGGNFQSESIMPCKWFYSNKIDSRNIIDIYNKYGSGKKLLTYPFLSLYGYLTFGKKYGKYFAPLSYLEYNKDKAKAILKKEVGWQDYGAKHHESFVTKFYQIYILPKKFNIDKRKAHLSSLICANQISRNTSLTELGMSFFKNGYEEKEAVEYFCKKMELSIDEFEQIMKLPRREHNDFKSYTKKIYQIIKIVKVVLLKK